VGGEFDLCEHRSECYGGGKRMHPPREGKRAER
jgi:hypothetical protein